MPAKRKATDAIPETVWAEQTVQSIREELERRGLPKAGKKADLVARLGADAAASAAASATASAASAASAATANISWAEQTVAVLRGELDRRGLPKAGKKADLVTRLEAADSDAAATEAPDPGPRAKKQKKGKKDSSLDPELDEQTAAELVSWTDRSRSGEVRARPFVPAPDDEYRKKFKKVKKERMFMLDRTKTVDGRGVASEVFDIAGSTGNIYQTTIGRSPKCTCMDARIRGQKCKHIYYALIVILKAPQHLCYQNAFLTEEIQTIFANAPVTRAADEHEHEHEEEPSSEESYAGKRKPVDGDCPICVFEMTADEDLVWCKASCGQNFHSECFGQWRRSKAGQRVTCVYCRSEWLEDGAPSPNKKRPAPGSLESLKETAPKVGSYRNIGHLPMYQQPKK